MMERTHRRPPDVEEALSSMLWTPYERTTTPTDSSSDDDDDAKLNTKLRKSQSSFDYYYPAAAAASAIATVAAGLSLSASESQTTIGDSPTNVPSRNTNLVRKIDRYDNFRFSYPYYGPISSLQKCVSAATTPSVTQPEPPTYESLYCNVTIPAVLSNLTAVRNWRSRSATSPTPDNADNDSEMAVKMDGQSRSQRHRMVHSFTDNFISVSEQQMHPDTKSGHRFSSNFVVEHSSPGTIDPTTSNESNQEVSKPEPNDDGDRLHSPITNEHVATTTTTTTTDRVRSVPTHTLGATAVSTTSDLTADGHIVCCSSVESCTTYSVKLSDIFVNSYSRSDALDTCAQTPVATSVGDLSPPSMAMRFNVPAASYTAVAPGKDTPLASSTSSVLLNAAVAIQPSVTIQVNDANNGISVVNCSGSSSSSGKCNSISNSSVPNLDSYVNNLHCHTFDRDDHDNDSDDTNNQTSDDVSIVQKTTTAIVCGARRPQVNIASSAAAHNQNGLPSTSSSASSSAATTPERTFTSTECQTDDLPIVRDDPLQTREQRRRERRERRHLAATHQPPLTAATARPRHPHPPPPPQRPMLPDILHSHYPPPYSALPLTNPLPPPPPASSLITPIISTVPLAPVAAISDGRFTIPLPIIRRSPSERSGKGCCGQWFAGPPLRALIAVVALGGVACALGGAALGATGLAGPPSSHLTAALLMIGVGVVLVTVSGAAWRMTAPGGPPCLGLGSSVDLARCGRRPCSRGGGAPHGLLYPEFQHRPPPPSYQASMQEYRLRLLLLDRDRQNGVVRGSSPPPTYRSHAGSLLRTPLTTVGRSGPGSEYSLPPSYRSRHIRCSTVAPNDITIDDPSSPSSQPHHALTISAPIRAEIEIISSDTSSAKDGGHHQVAQPQVAAVTQHSSIAGRKHTINFNEKLNPRALVSSSGSNSSSNCSNNSNSSNHSSTVIPKINSIRDPSKDLVTIVTISSGANETPMALRATSEMQILAHL